MWSFDLAEAIHELELHMQDTASKIPRTFFDSLSSGSLLGSLYSEMEFGAFLCISCILDSVSSMYMFL